jgi:glycosyltransferase involved in cell wall biosynthesis
VPPGAPAALAAAAIRLIDDAALRERLGAGAVAAAARFSWDRLALTLERAYDLAQPSHTGEQLG